MVPIKHLSNQYRFNIVIDGKEAFLQYRKLPDNVWEYAHTFVPQDFRHKGIGEDIVKFALDFARENHIKVRPTCPFVQHYLETHHEYDDLIVE